MNVIRCLTAVSIVKVLAVVSFGNIVFDHVLACVHVEQL